MTKLRIGNVPVLGAGKEGNAVAEMVADYLRHTLADVRPPERCEERHIGAYLRARR